MVCIEPGGRVEFRAFRPSGRPVAARVEAAAPVIRPGTAGLQRIPFRNLDIMKTFSAKPAEVRRDWYVVDATGKTLGRLSTEIARRLRGKHKPEYTPHVDTGDYIVVVNAKKIRVTGNKLKDKMYHHHTGYIGNLKSKSLETLLDEAPERVIQTAVKGMLPKGPLGRKMFSKLRVFAGPEHDHAAQQPIPLDVNA
jgi:large subunit ribosomal protein L13